jgi:hypothetical protein
VWIADLKGNCRLQIADCGLRIERRLLIDDLGFGIWDWDLRFGIADRKASVGC